MLFYMYNCIFRPCVVVKKNNAPTMGHYPTRGSPVSMGRYCKSGVVGIMPNNAPSNH
ncbi:hypothetical protein HanRHA438_Chr16g0739501 [Helianthus annuus]|nr:hypothetical protein HanRHA438_Chr16g0739501 [Helianthus annuus]